MADIVLALKPKWLELILSGKKTAEFRRVMPKVLVPGDKVYLYQGGALHGVAVVKETDYAYHCCHEDREEDCACLALSYARRPDVLIGVQLMVIYAAASVLELLSWIRFNGLLLQCSGGELWCRTLYIMPDWISGLKSRAPRMEGRTCNG